MSVFKKIGLVIFLVYSFSDIFSQCLEEPRRVVADNSIDTIWLTGRCGNPLGMSDPHYLDPQHFGYIRNYNDFGIIAGFAHNCASRAYLTVQANDSLIKIFKYEIDSGELTTCEEYEKFIFWFTLPSKSYFHIYENGFDTTVYGLTSIENKEKFYFNIYPNPSDNEVIIDIPGNNNPVEISLYNAIGERIYFAKESGNKYSINISDFNKGIYIIGISDFISHQGLVMKKLIIM